MLWNLCTMWYMVNTHFHSSLTHFKWLINLNISSTHSFNKLENFRMWKNKKLFPFLTREKFQCLETRAFCVDLAQLHLRPHAHLLVYLLLIYWICLYGSYTALIWDLYLNIFTDERFENFDIWAFYYDVKWYLSSNLFWLLWWKIRNKACS